MLFDVLGLAFCFMFVQMLKKEISQLDHLHDEASKKGNMDEYPFMKDCSELTLSDCFNAVMLINIAE